MTKIFALLAAAAAGIVLAMGVTVGALSLAGEDLATPSDSLEFRTAETRASPRTEGPERRQARAEHRADRRQERLQRRQQLTAARHEDHREQRHEDRAGTTAGSEDHGGEFEDRGGSDDGGADDD